MEMTGARIVVETLIEQGVDTIFGYPGGTILNVYDELFKCSDRIGISSPRTSRARPTRPTAMRARPAGPAS
jgi:thiamine pyrophosphate-dependent acetolactate synthase large subunit-like protein